MAGVDGSEDERLTFTQQPDYDALFGKQANKQQRFVQNTVLGEMRNVKRFAVVDWVFAVVATFSMLGVLALTIERFVYFERHFVNVTLSNSSTAAPCNNVICTSDFTFAVVLLINLAFVAFYYIDGIVRERQFEVLGYAIGAVVILLYIVVNFAAKGEEGQPIRLVRLVLLCVGAPINIALALAVWWKMGYLAFNIVGSNKQLVRAYKVRSLFLTLQHFNYQVMVNVFALAWARNGEFLSSAEKVILCLLLAYLVAVMVLGWAAALYEFNALAVAWYFLFFPVLAFYIYKIANVALHWPMYDYSYLTGGETKTAFHYVAATLIVVCVIGIAIYALLVSLMIGVQLNFRKGLKDKVPPPCHGMWNRVALWMKRDSNLMNN